MDGPATESEVFGRCLIGRRNYRTAHEYGKHSHRSRTQRAPTLPLLTFATSMSTITWPLQGQMNVRRFDVTQHLISYRQIIYDP